MNQCRRSTTRPTTPARERSERLFQRAKAVFPGGVTRSTIPASPTPIYADHGSGAYLIDVDGNEYLDFVNNYTVLIHGHAFPPVCDAVALSLRRGACFANPTESEIRLAEIICSRSTSFEKIRFVNTGTEAVMFAIKAARSITGRPSIAKFEGAYHGGYDWAEVSERSTTADWGDAASPVSTRYYPGQPQSVLDETVVLPMNDIEATLRLLDQRCRDLACVLVDVMPSRMGLVEIDRNYARFLREYTAQQDIVLISDEVLNFRQGFAGAAEIYGFAPDITVLGKIIGGGLPIGAIVGQEKYMNVFNPAHGERFVPQSGTFSANPISMAAGIASLDHLDHNAFAHLEALGRKLRDGARGIMEKLDIPLSISGTQSLFKFHASRLPPQSYRESMAEGQENSVLEHLCKYLAASGINYSTHGSGTTSTPMTFEDIDRFLEVLADFGESRRDTE